MKDTSSCFDGSDLSLEDVSPKDKPWNTHKKNNRQVAEIYKLGGFDRYVERLNDCANSLTFELKEDDEGKTHFRLSHARFCRVRWCPICQWRHSLSWRGKFLTHIPRIVHDFPTARFLFLTLTVENCELEALNGTIQNMNKSWQRLIQRKVFPAIGFIKSIEVTKAKDGKAHPHFHCLLMVRKSYFKSGYISYKKWTEMWKDCMKLDYTPIVHVTSIKESKNKNKQDLTKDLVAAICEVAKYSVKESDLITDANWLLELTHQMHRVRAISLGGVFKEYLKEEEPEDLIHVNEEPDDIELTDTDLELVFDWREILNKYMLRYS